MKTSILFVTVLALAASPTLAQDDEPVRPEDLLGGANPTDPRERLKELFFEVEGNLFQISEGLAEAGSGGVFDDPGDSGISKLLDSIDAQGRQVASGIDEILDIARQMQQQQSSSSSSSSSQQQQQQQQQQGQSPLDQERSQGSSQREQTPQGPRQDQQNQPQPGEQQGERPENQPQGQEPRPDGQENPSQDGEKPNDKGQNPKDGSNQAGTDDGRKRGNLFNNPRDDDSWGDLPMRTQEVFRNQGGEDLPVEYRDWIDSYYRRLNEVE